MIISLKSRYIWEDILFSFIINSTIFQIVTNLTTEVGYGIKNSSKIRGAKNEW